MTDTLPTGEIARNSAEPDRSDAVLPSPCVQNHAANLALLPNGTLACVWFGGTMEGMSDISVWISRLAAGSNRWSPAEMLTDDPARSEQNPVLFVAPGGVVWLFYTSQPGGRQNESVVMGRRSNDGGASFGVAERVCPLPGTFVRQTPVMTADGRWLLPAFRCNGRPDAVWRGDSDTAAVLVSRDQGTSWEMHDVPDSVGAMHMNILPAGPGRWVALFRDRFAENVRRSVSGDDGNSWSPPAATDAPNNNSSVQAIRCLSGRIAMVYNPSSASMSSDRRASL